MPRLFTGIVVSDSWRDRLALMRHALPGARWGDPDDYHLTLRFAGDLDRHGAREWADQLARVRCAPFRLRLDGLGAFGGGRPHTLYAAIAAEPALLTLQKAHERAARAARLAPETRNYTPHITLARLRGVDAFDLAPVLSALAGPFVEPLQVTEFVLFSARDHVGGGPYVVEEVFPLEAAGGAALGAIGAA